ncbi:beta-hexosaminidase subunit A1 [Pelomyxa schiedti]|nr:beta-hexosaminidase subunit A1 [Pelomyxa schiedti]
MKREVVLVCCALISGIYAAVWPQPYSMTQGTTVTMVDPRYFSIGTTSGSALLDRAIVRYMSLMFPFTSNAVTASSFKVSLVVGSDSEELTLETDDSYNITIGTNSLCTINSNSIFGAIHGLETLSQLIEYNYQPKVYSIFLPVTIVDVPRFPWRGLLIDSSRHFLELDLIYLLIDSLSYAKMNVLHWHITDAQSFPVQSTSYPLLIEGAYTSDTIYTPNDVTSVVDYALDRGVRVVPEFDVPGHSYSWGIGYPDITVSCPLIDSNINNVPLDPTIDFTYEVITGLFGDMSALFPDVFFHIGGDELSYSCWQENANVSKWMDENGYTPEQTEAYFFSKVHPIVEANGKIPISWEEVFTSGTPQPSDAIVQVWKNKKTIGDAANAGYRTLLSHGWYLDRQIPLPPKVHYEFEDTWKDFYDNDPTSNIGDVPPENLKNIIGGEAAMWGEQVDASNIQSRIWPRTAAIAERLWSNESVKGADLAEERLVEFRCHIAQRGIRAGPVAPDYCPLPKAFTSY